MIPTERNPHMPEGFRQRFIEQGWRGVERAYGHNRQVIKLFIAMCGGPKQLGAARKAYLAEQRLVARLNRKATGRAVQRLRVTGRMPEL